MTVAANHSLVSYGDNAQMHGLNITFLAMSLASAVLLLIAVFGVTKRRKKTGQKETEQAAG